MYVGDEPQQLTYTVLDGDTIAGLVWESSNRMWLSWTKTDV